MEIPDFDFMFNYWQPVKFAKLEFDFRRAYLIIFRISFIEFKFSFKFINLLNSCCCLKFKFFIFLFSIDALS